MRTLLHSLLLAGLCASPLDTVAQTRAPAARTMRGGVETGAPAARTMRGGVEERANPFAASMAAFQQRVKAYISLRDKVAGTMPEVKESSDPAKISAREKALGRAIAMERRAARAGDIFGNLSPYLQRIVDEDWDSRSVADRRALFEEIPPGLQLMVNQPYPTTIPLITAPGRLLARLPALPETVEYRLIERRLLLRDRDANLVVDVLTGVPGARSK